MCMTTVTRLCEIEDCDRAKVAFGLCESHRARLAKYGPIREDWPPIRPYAKTKMVTDELSVDQDRERQDVLGRTLYDGKPVEYLGDVVRDKITFAVVGTDEGEQVVRLDRLDWISSELVSA